MITLGIPGSPTAAVMLGGLLIRGFQPGPMLFTERPDFVWGLIASMDSGTVIGVLIVPLFAALLRLPFAILGRASSTSASSAPAPTMTAPRIGGIC